MQENNYKNNLIQLFSKFGKLPLLVDTKGIDEIM
jgi:hypothetical protein